MLVFADAAMSTCCLCQHACLLHKLAITTLFVVVLVADFATL